MPKVKGLKELSSKLNALERTVAGKTLRSAAMLATTPAMKRMKATAPRGKKLHRTYKGNLVAPGFLSRSIKRKSTYRNGRAKVSVGVKKEAFYGVLFVDPGTKPHRIPKKNWDPRRGGKWRKRGLAFNGRVVSHVNHPGASPKPWFKSSFVKSEREMVKKFAETLRKKVTQAVR